MGTLLEIQHQMGVIFWPLMLSLLIVVALVAWTGARLFRPDAVPDLQTKAWVDGILFWGGFALIAGVLGTVVGIVIASQSIELAGEVRPQLVWGGIKIALTSSVFGMLILAFAALAWFAIQLRWRLLRARLAESVATV